MYILRAAERIGGGQPVRELRPKPMWKPEDIHILIVDDVMSARRVVKRQLERFGYKSFSEGNHGGEALEVLKKEKINLIISDWSMPQFNGIDLLNAVRADAFHKSIPFIMITSTADREDIVDAVKRGVSDYIVKPFTTELLGEKVKLVLDKSGK